MSTFLSDSWESALLAKVVKEAHEVAKDQGGYLGRTALQKILYFLKVVNVPMRYRFDVHHYGPFCSTIVDDAEWLKADQAIVDRSAQSKYSVFEPGPQCNDLIAKHATKLMQYEETIRSVVKALLPLQPEHLELVATLDYSYREMKARSGGKPDRERVIERFFEFKGDKFTLEQVRETYDRLEKARLFT